ncbi:MAG: tetratricopeptide repeat protein [bacterium]
MLAYLLSILSLFSGLLIQDAEIKFEKNLNLKEKAINIGDVSNIYVDEYFNYYVLDTDNKKVIVFNSNIDLVKKIPAENTTKLFDTPIDIAVLKDGKILVLDKGLKKVIILNNDGEKLSEFGVAGSELGNFDNPTQIDVDYYGNIYVLDVGNKTIIKFNQQGLYRGSINIKNPVSFAISVNQTIHVLVNMDDIYTIQVFTKELTLKTQLALRSLKEPTDLVINKFNEYYIVDYELGSVFQFDSTGKTINQKIGIKGSNANVGTFAEPKKLCYQFVNDKDDRIYVFDEKFISIQSFDVILKETRIKIIAPQVKLDVQFLESAKIDPYIYLTINSNIFYFILPDYTLLAKRGNEEVFRITKQNAKQKNITLSDPVAIAVSNNKMYVVDESEDAVLMFDAKTGDYFSRFGESGSNDGQLNSPNGIVIDNTGKVYISDYKNSRINIYNEQGMYISKILIPNARPIKIACSLSNVIYVLLENKKNIYFVDVEKNKLEALSVQTLLADYEITTIAAVDQNILIAYDENYGIIHIFDNYKKVSEFLSKGEGTTQMKTVKNLSVNMSSNTIYVGTKDVNFSKVYKLLIPPSTPADIKLTVNNNGFAEIIWKGDDQRAAYYRVYRKREEDKEFQLFTKTTEPKIALETPAEFIYLYSIVAVSKDELVSANSEKISDEFSYLLFLKDYQPQQAIKKLETMKDLNPTGVITRIGLIYRDLIEKYRADKNYEMVIITLQEIIKIKPEDLDSYIELANAYKSLLKFSDGIKVLTDAKNRFSENVNVYVSLIRLSYLNKEYSNTIGICKEALVKFPDNEKILVSLAESYVSNNQKDEGLQIYKDLALKTGKESHYISAGKLLLEAGKTDDAINLYTQAQNTNVAGAELNAALAEAFIAKEKYADAIMQIEKSITADPKTAKYFYLLGLAHSKNRNKKVSIESFNKAVQLDSTQADFYVALGNDLEISNNTLQATTAYEKAFVLAPNNPAVLFSLGKVYLDQKKYDYACRLLIDANKLLPENAEIKNYLDKALVTRDKYNAKRDPIEIDKIVLDNLFPTLFNYYKNQPIGSITIFNTKNEAFDDIKIEISSSELLDEPSIINVSLLLPNDIKENLVYLKLKDALLKKSMDGTKDYNLTFTVTYKHKEQEKRITEKRTIKLHSLNSISWEDKKHLAGFIYSNDESIRNYITGNIIGKFSEITLANPNIPKPIIQTMQIWEYLRALNLTYVQDPNTSYKVVSESNVIDYVQFAAQTMERKSGDCDDLVTLMCTCLESVGISTAFIDVPGHVFMAFDAGLNTEKLIETGINENNLIIKNNKVWIPLETTVVGKNSFNEAWDAGIKRYLETLKSNQRLELIEVKNAANSYAPIQYPGVAFGTNVIPDYEAIKEKIKENITKFTNSTTQNIEVELKAILQKYPKNTYVADKLGLYYARNGKYPQAEIQFLNVLVEDKLDLVALISLGNVYYILKNFDKAESYYGRAVLIDENNAGLLVNMARLYLAMGKQVKAKECFSKAEKINPDITNQYAELIKRFN